MKKIYKYLLALFVCGATMTGCDLETNPTTSLEEDLIYSTTGDVEKVWNGSWSYLMETFNSYANPGYASVYRASDAMGNDCVLDLKKYGFGTHYKFGAMYSKTNGTVTLTWTLMYKVINNCNNIIARVDGANGTQEDKDRIKGQAYALRGFMYLTAAQFYSFAIDKDPNASCVPIYTEPTTPATEGKPVESLSKVYERAILDLEEAEKLIPATYSRGSAKHKINLQVVYGLLARANLYARNWAAAEAYAVKAHNHAQLMGEEEYMAGFNTTGGTEWIWGHAQTTDQSNASYSFYFIDVTSSVSYYKSFNADPWFMTLFDNTDYRKKLFTIGSNGLLGYAKFKFRTGELGDVVMMRTSEMYLIEAEAKARQNDPQAFTVLNDFKAARGAQAVGAGLSYPDLIEEILIERRKELFGEGFSLTDIIRTQKSVVRKEYDKKANHLMVGSDTIPSTAGHSVINFPDGSAFTANSKYYLFAIPLSEENNNPNLYK